MIAKSWRSNWTRVIPFFGHPPEIRKIIYTTNAIESLNMSLGKVTKARGSFPHDEAVSLLPSAFCLVPSAFCLLLSAPTSL